LRTPLVFCEIHPPDRFPLLFYRQPKAPDMNLTPADLDLDLVARAPLFWTTGTGLSDEPSRATTLAALSVRRDGITVHDLDHRPTFWTSTDEARRWARGALRHATVVVGNEDEVEMATGEREPRRAAEALLALGPGLAIEYVERDGTESRFFAGCLGIFGHGNVAGLGEALFAARDAFRLTTARSEQGMVHIACGYARMRDRLATFACTSSIGPGATNMLTGAALAT